MLLKKILGEFRKDLENLYSNRLKNIILYGSWARGEATEDSDIDIIVILSGSVIPGEEIDKMINIITEFNLKYDVLLSVMPISESNYNTINSPLLINARREGISA